MIPRIEISFAVKDTSRSPYASITHVGSLGPRSWKLDVPTMIRRIESGQWSFFVNCHGHAVDVVVSSRDGQRYLKAVSDRDEPLTLLSLPGDGGAIERTDTSGSRDARHDSATILAFPAANDR